MRYKYFKNVENIATLELEALRKQYKELIKQYHPDNGVTGSTEATQEINAEYNKLFKLLQDKYNSSTVNNSSTTTHSTTYDFQTDIKLREILNKVIGFQGVNIEIIGNWIWIAGNTFYYKSALKELGFKWASQKKQWYYHTEVYRKTSHKKLSMEEIRKHYGSTKVQTTEQRELLEV